MVKKNEDASMQYGRIPETPITEGAVRIGLQEYFVEDGILDIRFGNIKSPAEIEGLSKLDTLRVLHLDELGIERIEGLDGLTSLEELTMTGNRIHRIAGLDSLEHLVELDLSHNRIERVEGLSKLKRLARVRLSENQISWDVLVIDLGDADEEGFINGKKAVRYCKKHKV